MSVRNWPNCSLHSIIFVISNKNHLRRKKKISVVPVPDRPYFFLPTLLFFQRDWPCDPIFSGWLRAAAKMASVVTLIEKTMKKIFKKKIISDLPTLIFSRYETGVRNHRYFCFTPDHHPPMACCWVFREHRYSFVYIQMLLVRTSLC